MAEQTSTEPTMEEILASIRRIISEDETPEAEAKETPPAAVELPAAVEAEAAPRAPQPAAEPEPRPTPAAAAPEPAPTNAAAAPDDDDDALELTEKVETHGDLDVYTPAEPPPSRPEPDPPIAPAAAAAAAAAPTPAATLVSASAAAAAASAFGKLSQAVAMPAEGRTLEDVVRELLRPLLQQWLDDNLPAIVQQAVEAEVDRIARGRVR